MNATTPGCVQSCGAVARVVYQQARAFPFHKRSGQSAVACAVALPLFPKIRRSTVHLGRLVGGRAFFTHMVVAERASTKIGAYTCTSQVSLSVSLCCTVLRVDCRHNKIWLRAGTCGAQVVPFSRTEE